MKERMFDLRAEAACCIWECFLELRDSDNTSDTAVGIRNRFERSGTVAMRHEAIGLADLCCDVYDEFAQEEIEDLDLIPYDWEFVPHFVFAHEQTGSFTASEIKARMVENAKAAAAVRLPICTDDCCKVTS